MMAAVDDIFPRDPCAWRNLYSVLRPARATTRARGRRTAAEWARIIPAWEDRPGEWNTCIFALARARGWSDRALARRLGVSQGLVWLMRHGRRPIRPRVQAAALRAFWPLRFPDLFWRRS